MEKWSGKVALVSGSSSGIGQAIAEKLVEHGLKVVGFARRIDLLEEFAKRLSTKKGKFYPRQADISKEEDIFKVFQWTKDNVGPVSILINSAGTLQEDTISESSIQNWRDILNVNVLGLSIATKEAINQMKENNIDGHIININSIAGHKPVQSIPLNLYPSSKHAVTVFTEILRLELAGENSKIRVTSISPGAVNTAMVPPSIRNKVDFLKPLDVAEAALYVLGTPKHVNISELTIQPVGEKL